MALAPLELKQMGAQHLGIIWNDGHQSLFNVRNLRLKCRCANCVDEWTREKILKDETVPLDVKPRRIESVGRYALKVDWSDGHDTGIYTFEHLRAHCECPLCKPR
jgi:ATP-binding protein involved in chromosome partitioning